MRSGQGRDSAYNGSLGLGHCIVAAQIGQMKPHQIAQPPHPGRATVDARQNGRPVADPRPGLRLRYVYGGAIGGRFHLGHLHLNKSARPVVVSTLTTISGRISTAYWLIVGHDNSFLSKSRYAPASTHVRKRLVVALTTSVAGAV
jgi:hypothetical protein